MFFDFYNTLAEFFIVFIGLVATFIPKPISKILNNKRQKLTFQEKFYPCYLLDTMPRQWSPDVVFMFTGVTCGTPCYAISNQVIYHDSCKGFLPSGIFFYLTLLPVFFKVNSGADRSVSKLPGLHAACSSKHSSDPTVCLNHTTFHKLDIQ